MIVMDTDLKMPIVEQDLRIVLEHTTGRMKGIHSICGLKSLSISPLPEILDSVDMIDSPSMREPGPVSMVAVKKRYVLYRQIFAPTKMVGRVVPNAPFDKRQQ